MMIYAVGDIHGMFEKLVSLYNKILHDIKFKGNKKSTIIFLGDYVDRGPQSKEVLDFLMDLEDTETIEHIFLKGNHEDMMMEHWEHYPCPVFLNNGGLETLKSFGCSYDFSEYTGFSEYVKWINKLKLYHIINDYIFVHAGIEVNVPIENQREEVFIWKRNSSEVRHEYINSEYIVIHGHTPHFKPEVKTNEINVDTGACFGTKLTAVVLPEKSYPGMPHDELEFLTA